MHKDSLMDRTKELVILVNWGWTTSCLLSGHSRFNLCVCMCLCVSVFFFFFCFVLFQRFDYIDFKFHEILFSSYGIFYGFQIN